MRISDRTQSLLSTDSTLANRDALVSKWPDFPIRRWAHTLGDCYHIVRMDCRRVDLSCISALSTFRQATYIRLCNTLYGWPRQSVLSSTWKQHHHIYPTILPFILSAFEQNAEAYMHHILIQWADESGVHEIGTYEVMQAGEGTSE
jgi:hypothetical protein